MLPERRPAIKIETEEFFSIPTLPWYVDISFDDYDDSTLKDNQAWLTSKHGDFEEEKAPRLSNARYKAKLYGERWYILEVFKAQWSEKRVRANIYRPKIKIKWQTRPQSNGAGP